MGRTDHNGFPKHNKQRYKKKEDSLMNNLLLENYFGYPVSLFLCFGKKTMLLVW